MAVVLQLFVHLYNYIESLYILLQLAIVCKRLYYMSIILVLSVAVVLQLFTTITPVASVTCKLFSIKPACKCIYIIDLYTIP